MVVLKCKSCEFRTACENKLNAKAQRKNAKNRKEMNHVTLASIQKKIQRRGAVVIFGLLRNNLVVLIAIDYFY